MVGVYRFSIITTWCPTLRSRGSPSVARRPKFSRPASASLPDLLTRVRRAETEGRFQQALELAKSLYKQDPSPPHKELLQRVTLGRARQLRAQNHTRDALTALENAVALDSNRAWHEEVAQELAACGGVVRALALLQPYPDSPALPRVLALAADAALAQGKAGRALLPEALHGPFDLILQAFAQVEAGQDEQARAILQGIGLQSPFLEWKVLLRGLIAYYQKDDVRALENWQRLSADRLPARLVAPLRFSIDEPFRLAQPPATQTMLQQQADRLQTSGLVPQLRGLQATLANERQLPQAFRLAESLLPALRSQAPHLVPRLASVFYWMVIHAGRPEDVPRYQRVFGAPADDPKFSRLNALALEQRGQLAEAHKAWQEYEKEVADNPAAWPGYQAQRVRALIWQHMGNSAASVPDLKELGDLPPFLRDHPDRPRPLNPGPEKCFERSLELAPDQLEVFDAWFKLLVRKEKDREAIKVGQRLLERFPDHVPTLEALGDLYLDREKYAEGLDLLQRALRGNPLERRLRDKVGTAHLVYARHHCEQGRFDEARAEYGAAMSLGEGRKDATVLSKWAACEFKAGATERAEELLRDVLAAEGNRLAVAYSMLIESIRLKLPPAIKKRFDQEFKEGLAEPATPETAVALALTAAVHRQAGITYHGQKTHEKKVLAYLDRAAKLDFTEAQLAQICAALKDLGGPRMHLAYIRRGQQKFPRSPVFFLMEAERNVDLGPARCPIFETQQLLERAQERAAALPRDPGQQAMLETIKELQNMLAVLNPFAGFASGRMGLDFEDMFGFDDEDDYADEDDPFF